MSSSNKSLSDDAEESFKFLPLNSSCKISSSITSRVVGKLCKHLHEDFDTINGFSLETLLITSLDLSRVDVQQVLNAFYSDLTIRNWTTLIKKRQEKLGENYSCSPVHCDWFPDVLTTDLATIRNSKEIPLIRGSGDKIFVVTKEPKKSKEKKVKVCKVWEMNDNEKSFNIILYYMEAVIEKALKPELYLQLLLSHDLLIRESALFFIESKEDPDDFQEDYYKLLIQSWGSCLSLMDLLFSTTTFLYPIGIPTLQSAGGFYRISITRCLPDIVYYYFLALQSNTYVKTKTFNFESIVKAITEKNKVEILNKFIPKNFQNKPLVLDTSRIEVKNGPQADLSQAVFGVKVSDEKDVRALAYCSLSLIRYTKQLAKFILQESGTCSKFVTKEGLDSIQDIEDISMNYRFKELKNSKRASVYLVEKIENGEWKKHQVIKQLLSKNSFNNERRFGPVEIRLEQLQIIIMPHLPSLSEVLSLNTHLEWLKLALKGLNKLHSKSYVHGDIKPEHLLFNGKEIVFIDMEFVQTIDCPIIGYTKGFHPPEFDLADAENIMTATESDIYSLGLSFGTIIKAAEVLDPKLVERRDDIVIETLKYMTSDLQERFADAEAVLEFIEEKQRTMDTDE